MKRIRARITLFAGLLLAVASPVAPGGELTVTFIGNMAFHITDGETALLSDFPYQSGAFGYMKYEMADVPPIKDGLSLITHWHTDHWSLPLFAAMDTKLIAPDDVVAKIDDAARVIKIAPGAPAAFRGMTIEAAKTIHRLAPSHYSYIVTWHGKRLYFTGDTESPEYILDAKNIDVMFLSPWLIRTIERQKLSLDAKTLVVYHQKETEEIPPFQDYKRMKQGESFTVAFEDKP